MSKTVLSKRLQTIADMVTPGNSICDIGCDHAHIPIYLVENGKVPKAIVMDINTGPLERARVHIAAKGLLDVIDIRQSDGFKALKKGEVDTIIMSGMGGRLIEAILTAAHSKTADIKEFILGPQSEIPALRRYLRKSGYHTENEDLILEDEKFYPIIKVKQGKAKPNEPSATLIFDCYGKIPLKERNPVLLMYLKREYHATLGIINNINSSSYLSKQSEIKLNELKRKADELQDLINMW